MVEDVVVLLSSDDSDGSPSSGAPAWKATLPRTSTGAAIPASTAVGRTSTLEEDMPAIRVTSAAETARPESTIAIDGTPQAATASGRLAREAPLSSSRYRLLDLASSDDLTSSPFPVSAFSQRRQQRTQNLRNREPLNRRMQEGAGWSVHSQHAEDNSVVMLSDGEHGSPIRLSYGDFGRPTSLEEREEEVVTRPIKRPRLSPRPRASLAVSTRKISKPSISPFSQNISLMPSDRDKMAAFGDVSDESDDWDFSQHEQTEPATAATQFGAGCVVDLLSSSESEDDRIASARKESTSMDSGFDDIDDFLMRPSPPSKGASDRDLEKLPISLRKEKQAPVEIMTLSSSSPLGQASGGPVSPASFSAFQALFSDEDLETGFFTRRPTGHAVRTGRAMVTATDTTEIRNQPQPRRRLPLQRSFSEGYPLTFIEEDDEEDGSGLDDIDDLLAAWRKDGGSEQQRQHRLHSPPQAATRRRTSSDEGTGSREGGREGRPHRSVENSRSATALNGTERQATQREKEAAREEKRREKEVEKEKRQQKKQAEKERRRMVAEIAKEKKAHERAEAAAFNQANRSRVDKAVAAPEMIVQLPISLPQATREVVETLLGEIKAGFETWASAPVDNVVTWRRKVTAEYKPDLGHWVPVPEKIETEKYALVVLRGEELVQLILARQNNAQSPQPGEQNLHSHVVSMRRHFSDHTVLYLIEGLGAWKSKNRAIRNRQFAAAVRNASSINRSGNGEDLAGAPPPIRPSQRLGRRGQQQITTPQHVDDVLVEDALLELQVEYDGLLVHETNSPLDTARWIRVFTEQIATAPYRQQKEELYAAAASFCMDTGQIATGGYGADGAAETYSLMLQQIGRVTEPVALGVAARFGSVPKLVKGLAEEGPLALEACLKSRNRNGALSDRTVGPALSRRIYKVFLGQDATSTDV